MMKFLVVLAAFLAVSSAASLFRGKTFYKNWDSQDDLIRDRHSVQDEGFYGKYHGLGWLYGQQEGLGDYKYGPMFQGRQNFYDYYGNKDFYGNKDYYGTHDYYGNDDYYYGKKDLYYGNKDYFYDNMDSARYFNPFWTHVAQQGLTHQYENIVPYNFEHYNQIPSMYQHTYKGYYPLEHSYEHGYGYGHQYPSMYQNEYAHHYEPLVAHRQIAY